MNSTARALLGDITQQVGLLKLGILNRDVDEIKKHAAALARSGDSAWEKATHCAAHQNSTTPKLIVAFGSRAQVGKDTAYNALAQTGLPLQRVSFGDEMKRDLQPLFAQIGVDIFTEDPSTKKIIRPVMVAYAEQMKTFVPDYWVRRALEQQFEQPIVICTDLRFPVEAEAIKKLHGITVEIESNVPYANETEAVFSPLTAALADYTIHNHMTPQFMTDVCDLVQRLWDKRQEK